MKSFVRLATLLTLLGFVSAAVDAAEVLDLSSMIEGFDIGVQEDGDIIIVGRHGTLGRIAYVAPDLGSVTTADVPPINGVESSVLAVSDNGIWMSTLDETFTSGRAQVDDPANVENIGFLGPNPSTISPAIDNLGRNFGTTNGLAVPFRGVLGGVLAEISSGTSSEIWGVSMNTQIAAGSATDPNDDFVDHAAIFTDHRQFLARDVADTGSRVYDVSADGTILGTQRTILTFDPNTLEFTSVTHAGYYKDLDGVTSEDQLATDYERILLTMEDGILFEGLTTAVTNLEHGWIGGNTMDDEAWLMNIHTMTSPILAKDYLLSEFGMTLPNDPTGVLDLHVTDEGQLLTLFEGSTFLTRTPAITAIPEPTNTAMLGICAITIMARRRRRARRSLSMESHSPRKG